MSAKFEYVKYVSQNYVRDGGRAGYWEDANIDEEETLYYGDLTRDPSGDLMFVPYTTYSDYSGDTVDRSNCDVFMERYGNNPNVWEVYGGYRTRAMVIHRRVYDDPQTEEEEEIKECIDGLSDYPLIDEEYHSNLEFEMEGEAWNDYGRHDLRRALKEADIYTDEELDNISDEILDRMWYAICEKEAIYTIFEDAVSPYFDIDKVIKVWDKNILEKE